MMTHDHDGERDGGAGRDPGPDPAGDAHQGVPDLTHAAPETVEEARARAAAAAAADAGDPEAERARRREADLIGE